MALRGNSERAIRRGINAGYKLDSKDVLASQTTLPLEVEEKKVTPVLEDDSVLVETKEGIKPTGQAVTDLMTSEAKTKEEVALATEIGTEAQRDADANAELIRLQGTGETLNNVIEYDKYAERKPELTTSDIPVNAFMYGADDKERMLAELRQKSLLNKKTAAAPVLEKLGVEDYFPDMSKNIAVGVYSRKTLGSGSIFVAQGGVIPWGVVDARAKALEKDAKDKAAVADKIKNQRYVTSPQYEQTYNDGYFDWVDNMAEMAGGDFNVLSDPSTELGREFIAKSAKWETMYKENAAVDTAVKAILTRHQEGDFVPGDVLSWIDEWDTGRLNVDEYISGNKKVSELMDKIKSYESTRVWADEKLKTLKTEKDVMPLKAGVDFNNLTVAKNAADSLKRKAGQSYDEYLSAVGKYYDVSKMKNVIDGAFSTSSRFYKGKSDAELDSIKAEMLDYMLGSIGTEITVAQETVANKNLEYQKFAYQKEQDKTFYTNNDENQKLLGNEVQKIKSNANLTEDEKLKQINALYASNVNYDSEASKRFGFNVNAIPLGVEEQRYKTKATADDLIINFGKNKSIKLSEASEYMKYYKSKKWNDLSKNEQAQYKELKEWIEVGDKISSYGNVFEADAGKRYSTSFNTYSENGETKVAAGQWLDPRSPVQTMLIDEHNSVVVEKAVTVDGVTTYEPVVIKLPGSARTYKNGSDENVKYEFDAINVKTTTMTNKGED